MPYYNFTYKNKYAGFTLLISCVLAAETNASKALIDIDANDIVSQPQNEATRLIRITSRPYQPAITNPEEYDSETDDPFRPRYQEARILPSIPDENHQPVVIYNTPEENPNYIPTSCRKKCFLMTIGAGMSVATAGTISIILWLVFHG